jgi:hypothetical protein
MNALVGGQVDMMCDQTTNTTGPESPIRPRQGLCGHHVPAAEEQQDPEGPAHPKGNGPQHAWTIWHGL